jgi:hypothetical protein
MDVAKLSPIAANAEVANSVHLFIRYPLNVCDKDIDWVADDSRSLRVVTVKGQMHRSEIRKPLLSEIRPRETMVRLEQHGPLCDIYIAHKRMFSTADGLGLGICIAAEPQKSRVGGEID